MNKNDLQHLEHLENLNKKKMSLISFKKNLEYYVKITDDKIYNFLNDDVLFNLENNNKLFDILEKLNICSDKNCSDPRCNNIIILYTNKKVGSTSLWGSINLYLSNFFTTFHFHSSGDLFHLGVPNISVKQLIKILKLFKKNIIVIDIFRPIFEICVSNFFNELDFHFQRNIDIGPEVINKEIVINRFINLFEYYYERHDIDYLKDEFGLDLNFDFKSKHICHKDDNITYLKLRLCDSKEWHLILKKYLGYDFNIIKWNETKKKKEKYYNYFFDNIKIDLAIIEKIKKNISFNKYLDENEKESYFKALSSKISDKKWDFYSREQVNFYYENIFNNEVGLNYGHIGWFGNKPICNNCICSDCKEIRFNKLLKFNSYKYNHSIKKKEIDIRTKNINMVFS